MDAAHEHTDHVQQRPARLRSLPMPLTPDRVAVGRGPQELRAEVGNPIEDRRPVSPHVLAPSERPIGMRGLLALIVVLEAGQKRIQVMGVHRRIEALHDSARTGPSVRLHDESLDSHRPTRRSTRGHPQIRVWAGMPARAHCLVGFGVRPVGWIVVRRS